MIRNVKSFLLTKSIAFPTAAGQQMSSNCIFCKIIVGDAPGEVQFQDDELVVIKDIKPAAKFHYLAIPKEHIANVNSLSSKHGPLLERLVAVGKRVLEEKGGNAGDVRLGFHVPPFNSISHLHLHVISPESEMGFIGRCVFKPNTWWFNSADQVLEKIRNKL